MFDVTSTSTYDRKSYLTNLQVADVFLFMNVANVIIRRPVNVYI